MADIHKVYLSSLFLAYLFQFQNLTLLTSPLLSLLIGSVLARYFQVSKSKLKVSVILIEYIFFTLSFDHAGKHMPFKIRVIFKWIQSQLNWIPIILYCSYFTWMVVFQIWNQWQPYLFFENTNNNFYFYKGSVDSKCTSKCFSFFVCCSKRWRWGLLLLEYWSSFSTFISSLPQGSLSVTCSR